MRFLTPRMLTSSVLVLAAPALAQPIVPNFSVSTYADLPASYVPLNLDFDAAGFLYIASGDGNPAGVNLLRVPPVGGAPVHFASSPVIDPDGIRIDRAGAF